MIISKNKHAEAVKKIIAGLTSEQLADPQIKQFVDEASIELNRHYCVGWVNYLGDGAYALSGEPEIFADRDDALKHIVEKYDTECGFYDEEKRVWTQNGVDYPEKYEDDAVGVRLWIED